MTVARRMLMVVGGGSSLPAPPAATRQLTSAPSGGWTQANWPSGAHYNGKTYFGYVRGDNGNIEIRSYDHATDTTSAATVLHAALQADNHAAPSILVRNSDKRIIVSWSAHNGNQLYLAVSTNPEDISSFATTQQLNVTIGGGGGLYTYTTLIQLTGETDEPVYLFFRKFSGSTASLCFTKATSAGVDGGFWDTLVTVATRSTFRLYWMLWSDGDTRIDLVITDGSAGEESPVAVYHGYYEGGDWFDSEDNNLGASGINPQSFTLVYSQAKDVWSHSIVRVGADIYTVIATIDFSDTDFYYGHWNGSSWDVEFIASTTGILTGIVRLDDPASVYVAEEIGGTREIIRYRKVGGTWTPHVITSGSSEDQQYPVNVRDSASPVRILWLSGPWVSETNFSEGVMAGVG